MIKIMIKIPEWGIPLEVPERDWIRLEATETKWPWILPIPFVLKRQCLVLQAEMMLVGNLDFSKKQDLNYLIFK